MARTLTAMRTWVCALALVVASVAAADERPAPGQWFGSLGAAYLDPPSDYAIGSTVEPAVGLGYAFNDKLAIEMQWVPWQGSDGDADAFWVTGLIDLVAAHAPIDPYLAVGVGSTKFDLNGFSNTEEQVFVGVGFFAELNERWSLRADVRGVSTDGDGHGFAQIGVTRSFGRAGTSSRDDDQDGVPNRDDDCLDTPFGRTVDSRGCEVVPPDSDGDGVVDPSDRCPNTPAGVRVDSRGCELDGDRDGVVDRRDACPDSRPGARVDARGCERPPERTEIELNVEFDVDSDRIRSDADDDFARVMRFLENRANPKASVEGHTDSTGNADYNQGLSERRAKAVADRLIESGALSADQVEVVGHGEVRPTATNDTEEGRQRNRRASAAISAEENTED